MTAKIRIDVSPVTAAIMFDDAIPSVDRKSILTAVKNSIKGHPDGYRFMPRYKQGYWDGYISLLEDNKFPSGLVNVVNSVLQELSDEYEFSIEINNINSTIASVNWEQSFAGMNVELRDYQRDAVTSLLKVGRGVAAMATNSGKTVVIAAICAIVSNSRVIVLTHKKELLYQTSKVISDIIGEEVGMTGDSLYDTSCRVSVVMVQTAINLLKHDDLEFYKFLEDQQVLIVDEVHHISSHSFLDVTNNVKNAVMRFGFSGTPLTNKVLNDLQLIGATGDVICTVSNDMLVTNGYSAKPTIYMHTIANDKRDKKELYSDSYSLLVTNNVRRNMKITGIAFDELNKGNIVLVLVERLEHQSMLFGMMNRYTPVRKLVTCINGSQDSSLRNVILDAMRNGKPHIYIATNVLDEGVDVPSINTLILAGAGKSHIKVLQRVGRGMRKKDGNNSLKVIDFMDKGSKFLERHSKARRKVYEEEKFDIVDVN